jgi:hypothetical protein
MLSHRSEGRAAVEPQEVRAGVLGFAQVQVTPDQVPTLRRQPGPWQGEHLAPTTLKYSDEQTLTGLAAILHAMDRFHLKQADFADWGILACPRFIGRGGIAPAFGKFKTGGAAVIQPNLIPHRLLHALSGTLSQVLKMHGPNLGVGGGPLQDRELLQTAASFLISGQAPGYWLVFTGYDPECIPERADIPTPPWVCHGLAVALSASPNQSSWQLGIGAPSLVTDVPLLDEAPELLLHQFGDLLQRMTDGKRDASTTWQVPYGPRLTLAPVDADTAKETILPFPQTTYRVAV